MESLSMLQSLHIRDYLDIISFGVASSPAIFQKTMEILLQEVEGAVCFLDDILITGRTKAEHIQ